MPTPRPDFTDAARRTPVAARRAPAARRDAAGGLARVAAIAALAAVVAGCGALPASRSDAAPERPLPPEAFVADVLLIGEVHDNAGQHRLRLRWLEALADRRRFAIALEQLDADRQEDLDRARSADAAAGQALPVRARRIAEAAGFDFRGWDWALYGPVFELALRRELPLVAANLSRRETAAVARGRSTAAPEPPGWGVNERRALEESIRVGHCDLLPASSIAPMAAAQRSRDARLADSIASTRRRTGLPVVLLAGNGHVRRDIGVPRYLPQRLPDDRVYVIGVLESAPPEGTAFDHVEVTPAAEREDPCAGLRERMNRPQGPANAKP